jgi:predicted thioesterase
MIVGEADTARSMNTADVEVLSTPRLLAVCEEASMAALIGHLPPALTTVAVRTQFNHLAPVGIGGSIAAEATLERVEGRRLHFTLSARSGEANGALVGAGRLVRVIVERDVFLSKVQSTP